MILKCNDFHLNCSIFALDYGETHVLKRESGESPELCPQLHRRNRIYVLNIFHTIIAKPWQIPTLKAGSATVFMLFRA